MTTQPFWNDDPIEPVDERMLEDDEDFDTAFEPDDPFADPLRPRWMS